ncbi:DUF1203 domain-containing protein [Rhodospirillales bacterium]|nr:DUF1203 domain-containing protein [Rhodospirillales bacterium]
MSFQVYALDETQFKKYFTMYEAELAENNARLEVVQEHPRTPCRVSLDDAQIGETVALMNYTHQTGASPYKSSHAISVRKDVKAVQLPPGTIPHVLYSRLMSVRGFDQNHMMIAADVVDGEELQNTIETFFADTEVDYIHLHNAKPGCFAAKVTRA